MQINMNLVVEMARIKKRQTQFKLLFIRKLRLQNEKGIGPKITRKFRKPQRTTP